VDYARVRGHRALVRGHLLPPSQVADGVARSSRATARDSALATLLSRSFAFLILGSAALSRFQMLELRAGSSARRVGPKKASPPE
jgi:hypothetical protein